MSENDWNKGFAIFGLICFTCCVISVCCCTMTVYVIRAETQAIMDSLDTCKCPDAKPT